MRYLRKPNNNRMDKGQSMIQRVECLISDLSFHLLGCSQVQIYPELSAELAWFAIISHLLYALSLHCRCVTWCSSRSHFFIFQITQYAMISYLKSKPSRSIQETLSAVRASRSVSVRKTLRP